MTKLRKKAADPSARHSEAAGGTVRKKKDPVLGALKAGSTAVSFLSGLLASVLILYSGYVLYDSFATSYGAYLSSWDLMQYKPETVEPDPVEGRITLAEINEDYRGWLTIFDTGIDYPVMQGEDDLYYASHDAYNNVSLTGAIYLAAGNTRDGSDSYNLIYGHHMDNGAMFGQLDRFQEDDFYETHRLGAWVTESGIYDLYSFAVITTDAYENRIYEVGDRFRDVRTFLKDVRNGKLKPKQMTGIGTRVLRYDQALADSAIRILALSTCASAETNGRLVVLFRAVKHPLRLIIRCVNENGAEVFPTRRYTRTFGWEYDINSPRVSEYICDIDAVKGTLTEDTEVTVTYTKNTSGGATE